MPTVNVDPLVLAAARAQAKAEGRSLEEFVNLAIAQELSRSPIGTGTYFRLRRARAKKGRPLAELLKDLGAGQPPLPGDELPADQRRRRGLRAGAPASQRKR